MTRRGEDGSILVLTLGLLVVALMLVLAVVDASAVFLARRQLAAAADAAALDAADHPDLAAVYASGASGGVRLDDATVRSELARFQAAGGYPASWSFQAALTGPATALVTVREVLRLPVAGTVTVVASSRASAS